MKFLLPWLTLLLASVPSTSTAAECTAAYEQIACGYDCLAAYGQVKCAQTPRGTCSASYGEIFCWDPPRRRWARGDSAHVEAECVSAYGLSACGYDCTAAYGLVKCAQTPWGACEAAYGQVVCWDPAR